MVKRYKPMKFNFSSNSSAFSSFIIVFSILFSLAFPALCLIFNNKAKSHTELVQFLDGTFPFLTTIVFGILIISVLCALLTLFYRTNFRIKSALIVQFLLMTAICILCLIPTISNYINHKTPINDLAKSVYTFLLISGIVSGILAIILLIIVCVSHNISKLTSKVKKRISKCYLELHDTYICGFSFDDLEFSEKGESFKLDYCDIISVRSDYYNYCNLFIDHRDGTVKLPIEKNLEAADEIMSIKKSQK